MLSTNHAIHDNRKLVFLSFLEASLANLTAIAFASPPVLAKQTLWAHLSINNNSSASFTSSGLFKVEIFFYDFGNFLSICLLL